MESFRCIIVNWLVLKYVGTAGISSFAASNSLLAIFWAYPFGIMAVARILFSISIGEEDRRTATDVMHIVLTWGMLILSGITALLIVSAEPLTQLFFQDPADRVYRMTVMGFRLLPLCMPPALFTLTYACYAQVAEKKPVSTILPVFEGVIGVVACSLILIPLMGMNGLYLSNILNGFICLAVVIVSVWITQRRFPGKLEDILVFSKDFGVGEDERLDISVRTLEDAMEVSRQVIGFCTEKGINHRRAYFAGLCMEEMAGNVVLHGFTKDRKKHSLDIRVSHRGDDIILRLRDNCISFNPAERAGSREPEDGIKDIGIRLAYGIAKEFQYQNLLGLNVLVMRI